MTTPVIVWDTSLRQQDQFRANAVMRKSLDGMFVVGGYARLFATLFVISVIDQLACVSSDVSARTLRRPTLSFLLNDRLFQLFACECSTIVGLTSKYASTLDTTISKESTPRSLILLDQHVCKFAMLAWHGRFHM